MDNQQQGVCPNEECKSTELEYDTVVCDGADTIHYPFVCPQCGTEGKEIYDIDFQKFEVTS